ncbi:hypothetical protein LOK49_LG12G00015 [Camellia lanceoleosa]|uniref:Uncharacterized protein n=1 Tax=Camellia lanceoleosa TaxID=1840588 RepID=A0ACC0FQR0_9ERIC|nr:hypothetical protein LOK49_LG12G00015 [Camellia lanceoleosa]
MVLHPLGRVNSSRLFRNSPPSLKLHHHILFRPHHHHQHRR